MPPQFKDRPTSGSPQNAAHTNMGPHVAGSSRAGFRNVGAAALSPDNQPGYAAQRQALAVAIAKTTAVVGDELATGALENQANNNWLPLNVSRDGLFFTQAKSRGGGADVAMLERWIGGYNHAAVACAGVHSARGRIQVFEDASMDIMNPSAYEAEFDQFGVVASSDTTGTAGNMRIGLRGAPGIKSALAEMLSAQEVLSQVRMDLEMHRGEAQQALLQAEKAGLQGKIAGIEARIAQITGAISTVERIGVQVATAYATAGASLAIPAASGGAAAQVVDLSTRGQRAVQGLQRGADAASGFGLPTAGTMIGWVVDASYQAEIQELERQIGAIDDQIGAIEGRKSDLKMSQVLSSLTGVKHKLDGAKSVLEQAIGAQRGNVAELGIRIDQLRGASSGREASDVTPGALEEYARPDGAGRATAMMSLAQSMDEYTGFLETFVGQAGSIAPMGDQLLMHLVRGTHVSENYDADEDGTLDTFVPSDLSDRALVAAFKNHRPYLWQAQQLASKFSPLGDQWRALLERTIPGYKA